MNSYVSLAVSVAISAVGQLLFKAGALRPGSAGSLLLNPLVLVGFGAYFVAALFYVSALRTLPLSVAFPSVSVSYVLVALCAHWIWREPFGAKHLVSLGFISIGILVLARSV